MAMRKRADEFGGKIRGVFLLQFLFNPRHGDAKILGRPAQRAE